MRIEQISELPKGVHARMRQLELTVERLKIELDTEGLMLIVAYTSPTDGALQVIDGGYMPIPASQLYTMLAGIHKAEEEEAKCSKPPSI